MITIVYKKEEGKKVATKITEHIAKAAKGAAKN